MKPSIAGNESNDVAIADDMLMIVMMMVMTADFLDY